MIICHLNICWTSLLVLTLVILFAMSSDADEKYVSVDFEVFGNVQGVCFRMYTEAEGKNLGVTGWVKNTRQGTVVGQVQGPPEKVKEMKHWLSKVGSPSSRIERTQFSNERRISKLEIRGFGTRY
ncbi:acylphosphatase 2, muscle type isoform X1 [Siphateles boraxobius]|uniref:acylphosphatase 2, muscle type isoform X1 n=2 Tax=Siphateles boraxobius TaxID=180520 RepID=UPI0040644F8A